MAQTLYSRLKMRYSFKTKVYIAIGLGTGLLTILGLANVSPFIIAGCAIVLIGLLVLAIIMRNSVCPDATASCD